MRESFGAAAAPWAAETALVNGAAAVVLPLELHSTEGPMQAVFAAYAGRNGSAYHFLFLAPPGAALPTEAMDLLRSSRRLSANDAAGLRPRVIDVVTAREADSLLPWRA